MRHTCQFNILFYFIFYWRHRLEDKRDVRGLIALHSHWPRSVKTPFLRAKSSDFCWGRGTIRFARGFTNFTPVSVVKRELYKQQSCFDLQNLYHILNVGNCRFHKAWLRRVPVNDILFSGKTSGKRYCLQGRHRVNDIQFSGKKHKIN